MNRPGTTPRRWTLQNLIDFEIAVADKDTASPRGELIQDIRKIKGDSLTRKRRGLLLWATAEGRPAIGQRLTAALSLLTAILCLAAFISSAGSAWGTYNAAHNGIHVVLFLALTLFLPWLIFLCGLLMMMFRRKLTPLGIAGGLMIKFIKSRLSIPAMTSGPLLENSGILAWRISRSLQMIAMAYHLGAIAALTCLVFFRHIHFYWESTTHFAMTRMLESWVAVLSSPWARWIPSAVPEVSATRWIPGQVPDIATSDTNWWPFLILCLLVWGIVPRLVLAVFSMQRERFLLDRLSFQAPHHRKLWRALDGVKRDDPADGPLDGALVIDIGGIHPDRDELRPFMLQHLRMNPTSWESSGVLDEQRSQAAQAAIRQAPAGIVLLAESWALSPPEMRALIGKIRAQHRQKRIAILCLFREEKPDEMNPWHDFVDSLNDPHVEIAFCQIPI